MITILAVLCSMVNGDSCRTVTVTTDELQQPLTLTACMVGMPALADWMKQYPAERLASWRCVLGGGKGQPI